MKQKHFYGYVLVDPKTKIPRYAGITTTSLEKRLKGHLNDVIYRPELNKHKTSWILKLQKENLNPEIQLIQEFDNLEDLKIWEISYISKYKEIYKLINQTNGGDGMGFHVHSRESILKKSNTRAIIQYNVLGEQIAEYEVIEDAMRALNLRKKACSHITQCCKHIRTNAYGYLWKYKNDSTPLPILNITDIAFNNIAQYDIQGNQIAIYTSYSKASKAVGDKSHGSNIQECCLNKQKSCKGFIWKLIPNYKFFNKELFNIRLKETPIIRKNKSASKKVLQYDLQGNLIAEFNSIIEAAKLTKSSRTQIRDCCNQKRKVFKNFIWKYAEVS